MAVLGGEKTMEWTAPKFEEVALNCEINSYASAAL
jgi:coenzyme PQQ precursor peptide PqqA